MWKEIDAEQHRGFHYGKHGQGVHFKRSNLNGQKGTVRGRFSDSMTVLVGSKLMLLHRYKLEAFSESMALVNKHAGVFAIFGQESLDWKFAYGSNPSTIVLDQIELTFKIARKV